MRLVDNDTLSAGNRSPVHGPRPSVQWRDGGGNAVFAGQPSSAGVDGADAVFRLEHRRAGGSDRKCRRIALSYSVLELEGARDHIPLVV